MSETSRYFDCYFRRRVYTIRYCNIRSTVENLKSGIQELCGGVLRTDENEKRRIRPQNAPPAPATVIHPGAQYEVTLMTDVGCVGYASEEEK